MVNVLVYRMNPHEVYVLERLCQKLGQDYLIIDLSKEKDFDQKLKTIVSYTPTKGTSKIEEAIHEIAGKDFLKLDHVIAIPKPSSFKTDESLQQEVWDKMNAFADKEHNIDDSDFNPNLIPEAIYNNFKEIKESVYNQKPVYFINAEGIEMEIRPNNLEKTRNQSLTFNEFLILIGAKYILNFKKVRF